MGIFANFLKKIKIFIFSDIDGFFFFLHTFMLIYRGLILNLKTIELNDLIADSFCIFTIVLETFYLIATKLKGIRIKQRLLEFLIIFCLTSHIFILFMTSEDKSSMCIISRTSEIFFCFRRIFTKIDVHLRFLSVFIVFCFLAFNFGFRKEFLFEIPPLFFSLILLLKKQDIQLYFPKYKDKQSSIMRKNIHSLDKKIDLKAKKPSITDKFSALSNDDFTSAILNSTKKGLLLFDENLKLQFVNHQTKEYIEAEDLSQIENIFKEMMVNIDGDQKFAYEKISIHYETLKINMANKFSSVFCSENESCYKIKKKGSLSSYLNNENNIFCFPTNKNNSIYQPNEIILENENEEYKKRNHDNSECLKNTCIYFSNRNSPIEQESKKNLYFLKSEDETFEDIKMSFVLENIFKNRYSFDKIYPKTYAVQTNLNGKEVSINLKLISPLGNSYDTFFLLAKMNRKNNLKINDEKLQLEKSRQEFFNSLCHELKTPINCVSNMLDLIQDNMNEKNLSNDNKLILDYLSSAIITTDLLMSVIHDLLDFFSFSSDLFSLDLNIFNLEKTVIDVFQKFEFIAKKKNLKMHFYFDSTIPKQICNDEKRLKQILYNLLSKKKKK